MGATAVAAALPILLGLSGYLRFARMLATAVLRAALSGSIMHFKIQGRAGSLSV